MSAQAETLAKGIVGKTVLFVIEQTCRDRAGWMRTRSGVHRASIQGLGGFRSVATGGVSAM